MFSALSIVSAIDRKIEELASAGFSSEDFTQDAQIWKGLDANEKVRQYEAAYAVMQELAKTREIAGMLEQRLG